MATLKHKKVYVEDKTIVNPYPQKLVIPSDGNELTYKSHDNKLITYVYTVSNTKLNRELTVTPEQLDRLLRFATDVAKIKL